MNKSIGLKTKAYNRDSTGNTRVGHRDRHAYYKSVTYTGIILEYQLRIYQIVQRYNAIPTGNATSITAPVNIIT